MTSSFTHGTVSGVKHHGCVCIDCRIAWAQYLERERRQKNGRDMPALASAPLDAPRCECDSATRLVIDGRCWKCGKAP